MQSRTGEGNLSASLSSLVSVCISCWTVLCLKVSVDVVEVRLQLTCRIRLNAGIGSSSSSSRRCQLDRITSSANPAHSIFTSNAGRVHRSDSSSRRYPCHQSFVKAHRHYKLSPKPGVKTRNTLAVCANFWWRNALSMSNAFTMHGSLGNAENDPLRFALTAP